jgi:pectinesterase
VDSCRAINFKSLTIENRYGFENKTAIKIACAADTAKYKLVQPNGHQMAFRSFNATQLKFVNCHFKAFGGDTMSPWNTTDGMFYFKDCLLEGGVDFYCHRGWAYAESCTFISNTGTAAIWHDGSLHEDAKSVLVNCNFKGFDGFNLGRFHRDAQFYLINCHYASNMSNTDIYQVKTSNTLSWPRRVYYFNDAPSENKFYKNNLHEAKGQPDVLNINANWVFNERWNPLLQ